MAAMLRYATVMTIKDGVILELRRFVMALGR